MWSPQFLELERLYSSGTDLRCKKSLIAEYDKIISTNWSAAGAHMHIGVHRQRGFEGNFFLSIGAENVQIRQNMVTNFFYVYDEPKHFEIEF
jgi:hypothetical protein